MCYISFSRYKENKNIITKELYRYLAYTSYLYLNHSLYFYLFLRKELHTQFVVLLFYQFHLSYSFLLLRRSNKLKCCAASNHSPILLFFSVAKETIHKMLCYIQLFTDPIPHIYSFLLLRIPIK